jgi:hypothetical protein
MASILPGGPVGEALLPQMLRRGIHLRNPEQMPPDRLIGNDRTIHLRKQQWRCLGAGARPGVEDVRRETSAECRLGWADIYTDIGRFLRNGAGGPEHQALLELIGTLLDG